MTQYVCSYCGSPCWNDTRGGSANQILMCGHESSGDWDLGTYQQGLGKPVPSGAYRNSSPPPSPPPSPPAAPVKPPVKPPESKKDPVEMLRPFLQELASDKATPGGGAVAALSAALAAASAEMVGALTKGLVAETDDVKDAIKRLAQFQEKAFQGIEEDGVAFRALAKTWKLPRKTKQERQERRRAVSIAATKAAEVPLSCARLALSMMKDIRLLAEWGNTNAVTDAGTAAIMAHAAVDTALLNVKINIQSIQDETVIDDLYGTVYGLGLEAQEKRDEILAIVEGRM